MTRDELNEMLATEPATRNQVGAIHREFERLGFREKDRAERLSVSAAMLELGSLGSTRDLTMGQAGCLVCLLLVTGDRSELPAPGRPAAVEADDAGCDRDCSTLAAVIRAMVVAYMCAVAPGGAGAVSGKTGDSAERGRSRSQCPP
jgi:hypothetical protein